VVDEEKLSFSQDDGSGADRVVHRQECRLAVIERQPRALAWAGVLAQGSRCQSLRLQREPWGRCAGPHRTTRLWSHVASTRLPTLAWRPVDQLRARKARQARCPDRAVPPLLGASVRGPGCGVHSGGTTDRGSRQSRRRQRLADHPARGAESRVREGTRRQERR